MYFYSACVSCRCSDKIDTRTQSLRSSPAGQSRGSVGRAVSWTSQSHASPGLHFGAGGKATEVPPWLVKVRPCLPRQSSVPSLCQSCATPHAFLAPPSRKLKSAPLATSLSIVASSAFHAAIIRAEKPRLLCASSCTPSTSSSLSTRPGCLLLTASIRGVKPNRSGRFTSPAKSAPAAASAASSCSGVVSQTRTAATIGGSFGEAVSRMLSAFRHSGVSSGAPFSSEG
mmetsp:Transcript_41316/g.134877  ORF Transcript_41316/g.134877 Transcript_41316/m.134877 type:complete len:228 (+) Transcript_41316:13-696(+)